MAPDLTRADADKAIEGVKYALGGLGHLAWADAQIAAAYRVVAVRTAVDELVAILGEFALQLPEDEKATPDQTPSLRQIAEQAHYLSTACLHGAHDQCRRTCKFCQRPCWCACHQEDHE